MAIEIKQWDWRHKVSYCADSKELVLKSIEQVENQKYKDILVSLLNKYETIVSFDALIEDVISKELNITKVANKIDTKFLLHIPQELENYYLQKLEQVKHDIGFDECELMTTLFKIARQTKFENHNRDIFEIVFGNSILNLLLDKANSDADDSLKSVSEDELLSELEVKSTVNNFRDYMLENGNPLVKDCISSLPTYKIQYKNEPGFAEYWPYYLDDNFTENTLIIHLNEDSCKLSNIETTLTHELFPGHGYFYERLDNSEPCFVDHGAYTLVEGWATWAEWHGVENRFSNFVRNQRLRSIANFDRNDGEVASDVINLGKDYGSDEFALLSCMYFFQYPGFGYSYTLGALWFEYVLEKYTIEEVFTRFHCEGYWGDFFKCWN